MGVIDSDRAIAAQLAADDAAQLAATDPLRRRFDAPRHTDTVLWDIALLYYPWGDSRWRPYFLLGFGVASVEFTDRLSVGYSDTAFELPLAMGLKFYQNDFIVFRLELADNIAFFNGNVEAINHLSIIGGMEVRFGGRRRAYWPWNPGRVCW
jgi:hypothetical protein